MSLKLIKPCALYQQSYYRYIKDLAGEERYPFPLDFDHTHFDKLLKKLEDYSKGINLAPGFVASSTFWFIQQEELVGVSNLRHTLNRQIRHIGGHIGLGIRPGYRGQGLGVQLLNLTLREAKSRGMRRLHIHCHKSNLASVNMILACNGTLDSEVVEKDSKLIIQRYICILNGL